jgi:hypothetical protein
MFRCNQSRSIAVICFYLPFSLRRRATLSLISLSAFVAVLLATASVACAQSPLPTVEQMQRVADNLDKIKKTIEIMAPAIPRQVSDPLDDISRYAKDFGDLALALRQDIAENITPGANNSHTTQALAAVTLDQYTDPSRMQDLRKLGAIDKVAMREFGFLSFGAGDIVQGASNMAARGAGNVDAARALLDGINSTAWGVLGYALTGNWKVAQAYATAGGVAAQTMRDATLPAFQQIVSRLNGTDDKIVALWEEAQKVRIAHGLPPQTIQQFYSGKTEAVTLDQVSPQALARASARLGLSEPFEQRTVEHYRQTCIAGSCTRVDLTAEPDVTRKPPIGGVRLDQPLTGAALRGVKIDAANGNIILVGERDFLARGLNLRDFAVALWLVFGPQAQDPAFSLDPDDVRNPEGPWLRARYEPQLLQGRSFGADLFEADLLLKELSFEVMRDPDGKLKEWQSAVPGFHSYAELAMADVGQDQGQPQWARFWIVVDRVTVRVAGDTELFDARMAVKARRQVPDPQSATGLRDVDTDPDTLEARWAQIATDHYDALATESPAFARVRELALAMAVAKSLKTAGAAVDLARVIDLVNADRIPTVSRINAFSVDRQHTTNTPYRDGDRQGVRTEVQTLHLFGGVDLSLEPRGERDDGSASSLKQAVDSAIHAAGAASIVRVEYGGTRLEAVALPLLVKSAGMRN